MYRYRYEGPSRNVVSRFVKHADRIGKVVKVVAKRFVSTRSYMWEGERRSYTTDHEVLMVYGETGTARLSGCCWGYGGEGPHAVRDLLVAVGLPNADADRFAFESVRGTERVNMVDWSITV